MNSYFGPLGRYRRTYQSLRGGRRGREGGDLLTVRDCDGQFELLTSTERGGGGVS